MPKRFLLFFFLLCSSQLFAQSFYMVGSNGKLSRVTVKGTNVSFESIDNECSVAMGSIAVYHNTIYYFDGGEIKKATIAGNRLIDCEVVGRYSIGNNALTVDKNGILYGAFADKLYKIDPVTGILTNLGTMPYQSGGDLIFYKDVLYLASGDGVVKINLANPMQSKLILPDVGSGFGLAAVPYSSTANRVYLFDGQGGIAELDLDNNKVLTRFYDKGLIVYDAASVVEDGSVAAIKIDSIRQYADCPFTGKGTIEVICYNSLADYTFELNGITNTSGVFTNLSPGTFHIKVKSSLEVKDTVITVAGFLLEKPKVSITTVNNLCDEPGQITLRASARDNSLYTVKYNNLSYGINDKHDNLKAGTHRFIVLNKAGCAVDTIDVVLDRCQIKPDGAEVQQECNSIFKASVRIKTLPHTATYTFKLGSTTNTTGFFSGLGKGTYKVTITSADDMKEVDVTVPDYEALAPMISYKATNVICDAPGSIKFNMVGDATGYTIKLDEKLYPFLNEFKLDAGTYTFTVIKPDGCLLKSYQATLAAEGCDELIFPNTFTPNNDGVNDVFEADKRSRADNYTLKIYNRNGELLFQSVNLRSSWDGTFKGKPVPIGVYYYVVTYGNNSGSNLSKSGFVTLVK